MEKIQIDLTDKKEAAKKVYKCKACPKKFQTEAGRYLHIYENHDCTRFKCQICSVTYSSQLDCIKHLKQDHDVTEPQFEKLRSLKNFDM